MSTFLKDSEIKTINEEVEETISVVQEIPKIGTGLAA